MSNSLSKQPMIGDIYSSVYEPLAENPEKEDQILTDLMQLISSSQEIWSHTDPPEMFTIDIEHINFNKNDIITTALKKLLTQRGSIRLPELFEGMPFNTQVEKAAKCFEYTTDLLITIDLFLDGEKRRRFNRPLNHPYNHEQLAKLFKQAQDAEVIGASIQIFKYWTTALGYISNNLTSGPKFQNAFVTWNRVRVVEIFLATAQMKNHQAIIAEFPNTKPPVNTRSSSV